MKTNRIALLAGGCISAILTAPEAVIAAEDGDRVVVTATRTSADWLTRAEPISRFDNEEILRVDADHIEELLNRAPGVYLHRGSGAEYLPAIRSPVLSAGAGAGSFLYLEDGVPLRAAGFANINGLFESMSDLAGAVEVVRGPGSVLYGSNAVHGTVNILTPMPDMDEMRLELSASTLDRKKGVAEFFNEGGANSFYAGLSVVDEGGWREAAGLDQQKLLLRWDTDGAGWSAVSTLAFNNLQQETAGFVNGDDSYRDIDLARGNENPEAYRDTYAVRAQSRIEFERSDDLLFAVTPYARYTEMEFLQHFLPATPLEESGHWSVGALTSAYWNAASNIEIIVGADFEYTDGYLYEFQEQPTSFSFVQGVHYDYDVESTVGALYADADITLSENWSAQLGARAERTRYEYDNHAAPTEVGRFRRPDDRTDEFNTFTPTASLLRRFGDDSIAYARYARGARAPQTSDAYRLTFSTADPTGGQMAGEIKPERIDSFEIGWRGSNDFLTWDLAAFTMDKENFFFRDSDFLNVVDGETSHEGVEALLIVPLGEMFELTTAATYAQHTYEFDRPANGIVSGTEMDSAPEWLGNTRLAWTPSPDFLFEGEWVHVGEYFTDEANAATYPGHDIFNLRGEWTPSDELTVFAILRNVADERYAERADFNGFSGQNRYFPGEERALTVGVRVSH